MNLLVVPFVIFFILLLPGLLLSFLLFSSDSIKFSERTSLTFALSMAIVPLVVFYGDFVGISLNQFNVLFIIFVILLFLLILILIKYKFILLKKPVKFRYVKFLSTEKVSSNKNVFQSKIIHTISKELFQISLITHILLHIFETVKPLFVSYYFDNNILLMVVMISGVLMVITQSDKRISEKKTWSQFFHSIPVQSAYQNFPKELKKWEFYYILSLSISSGILVFYKTEDLGFVSIILTLMTMVFAFLLITIIYVRHDSE